MLSSPREYSGNRGGTMETHCETLLSSRGEASGMALPTDILGYRRRLDADRQREFMRLLLTKFEPKVERLEKAIDEFRRDPYQVALLELHIATEPRRQELIRCFSLAPNGIATRVRMRGWGQAVACHPCNPVLPLLSVF